MCTPAPFACAPAAAPALRLRCPASPPQLVLPLSCRSAAVVGAPALAAAAAQCLPRPAHKPAHTPAQLPRQVLTPGRYAPALHLHLHGPAPNALMLSCCGRCQCKGSLHGQHAPPLPSRCTCAAQPPLPLPLPLPLTVSRDLRAPLPLPNAPPAPADPALRLPCPGCRPGAWIGANGQHLLPLPVLAAAPALPGSPCCSAAAMGGQCLTAHVPLPCASLAPRLLSCHDKCSSAGRNSCPAAPPPPPSQLPR